MEQKMQYALEILILGTKTAFTTNQSFIAIGRDPGCELAFPDCNALSRRHAEIFYQNGIWYLMDRGSTNGTWLNDERITPFVKYPLEPFDKILLAKTCKVEFVYGGEPDAAQLTPLQQAASRPETYGAVPEEPPQPAPGQSRFCPVCGSRAEGMFCVCCGANVSANSVPARPVEHPRPAASMAPPAPSAMPAPPAMAQASPAMPPTAAPPKKKSFFGSLFGSKVPKETAPQTDDIQFRAAAPAALKPGEYFTVKVMMYREDDYARADREQKTIADRVKAASSSIFQAKKEDRFRICLQSPDIPTDGESAELVWNGKYAAADMDVLLPEDYRGRQLRLTGRVYSGIAVLTDLKLILQVDAPQQQEVRFEKCSLRSAFISYASQDRAKVVARIQGIQLSCPDMDLFFDAESLRRGELWEQRLYREIEDRDLFYLFWSRNAANSEWVAKELAYAMEKKGAAAVEPVPLEDPSMCPPPQSLQDRHFNDWTLRYLAGK